MRDVEECSRFSLSFPYPGNRYTVSEVAGALISYSGFTCFGIGYSSLMTLKDFYNTTDPI